MKEFKDTNHQATKPQGFFKSFWEGKGSLSKSLMISLALSVAATLLFKSSFIFFFVFPLYPLQVAYNNFRREMKKGKKE